MCKLDKGRLEEGDVLVVRKNESGVTLVELLAVLVLLSIVTAVIWNTIFISMRHNTTETKKTRLQQEANYVIAEIQRYHRQCDTYNLTIKTDEVAIKDCMRIPSDPREGPSHPLPELKISNGFQYISSEESTENSFADSTNEPINSKGENASVSFTLTIQDTGNDNLNVSIPTTISRYSSERHEKEEGG